MSDVALRLRILEAVEANLNSLISYVDTNLNYVYVNDAYTKWFNVSREHCIGRGMAEIVGASPVAHVRHHLDRALKGETVLFEATVDYNHLGPRTVRVRYIPDRIDDGDVLGLIILVHDISAFVERSNRFRDIYEVSPLAIGIFDLSGRFLNANQAYQRLLGYTEDELRHKALSELTVPGDRTLTTNAVRNTLADNTDYQRYEKRYVTKSGETVTVRVTGRRVPSENGEHKLLAICEDITVQKQIEQELNQAHELTHAIIRSARSSIITTDLNGVITQFNAASEKMLGYSREEIVGIQTPKIFHLPEEIAAAAHQLSIQLQRKVSPGFETLTHKARRGEHEEKEWTFVHKNGKRFPIRLSLSGLYDSNQQLTGFLGVASDLTEYKELEMQLATERSRASHNAKLASLGEMSAGIAHEINNPLGILMGSLPLLEKFKDDPEKFGRKIENATGAGKRIEKIVKGLRRFARTTEGTDHKENSLCEIVNEALVITEAKSKRHGTAVTTMYHGNPILVCDGVEIEQVVVNLINNAVDANREHDDRWIHIEVAETTETAVIRVTDSGAGISEEIEQKLFLPFFTTKPVGEGTGLGLSIAKGIIDTHKGTLSLNRSGPHTCFEIHLPKNAKVSHAG